MGLQEKIIREPYTAYQLEENFWVIDQYFVRSFLIIGKDEALLIDTCDADADLKGFVKELTQLPVRLVQTHCDADHIGASLQFEKAYMHPAEYSLCRETTDKPIQFASLREGEILDLGYRQFEVLLIPGHTPGSIALLDRENKLLLSGDSVKQDIHYMFGPGRNLEAYIDSLTRLNGMRNLFDTILPSHGDIPISPDIIPDLIEGAGKLLRGELAGVDDGCGMPCLLYIWKRAKFYY